MAHQRRAEDDQRLVEWEYALVNLCARPTKTASELTRAERARGRKQLIDKIRAMRPRRRRPGRGHAVSDPVRPQARDAGARARVEALLAASGVRPRLVRALGG